MATAPTNFVADLPDGLPAELYALMGIFLTFWKTEERVEAIEVQPPLTKNERMMLFFLGTQHRMGQLATDMQMLPSAVTALADTLQSKGLVARVRDPDDRRAWRLDLTREGHEVRCALMTSACRIFQEVAGLSAKETETIAALMRKVARNIKASGLPEGAKKCE
ncbi:MarR family winged helix-turn-helix transcriptional regulator [Pseudooceanicola aestuarii]|uniref:MarR family winged helix-turn-helix transcriptional regulator n=1 Tax=Pseudooceanicola aestuarii TaxID=2697319 RepID=UPI0013D702E4|nr:MarR family transcriptional regulator [Pseudooceanicola aestuarii]